MKTINLRVTNNFTKENICMITFPYDQEQAMDGFYSGWWREVKEDIASAKKIDKKHLKLKIWVGESGTYKARTVISFPSGTKANLPSIFDMTEKDFRIFDLHMEAAQLALSK